MRRIIVPIDFSKHSEYALKAAVKLARVNNAEILALHMLEMSDIMLSSSTGFQVEKEAFFFNLAEKNFNDFLEKDYLKGVNIVPIIKHFKVFSEVSEVAKKYRVDLIVMGSHGVNGAKEFFVGSNTERVVRHSNIPVLVVKKELTNIDFEAVVFACDFSEETITPYLNARDIFDALGAKLYLVYVNLPNNSFKSSVEIERRVVNFFTKADNNLDKMEDVIYVSDYTVEDGVLTSANKIGADLIAVPTHGRKGLSHFFQGSIGEDIANHSTLPVMTFKI